MYGFTHSKQRKLSGEFTVDSNFLILTLPGNAAFTRELEAKVKFLRHVFEIVFEIWSKNLESKTIVNWKDIKETFVADFKKSTVI